jgi:pimeloyl-ACP methyl ester carboxylesterase
MPEDHYLSVSGRRVRYWALGERGTSVILLHGLGASADIWIHNVIPLARQHRVYVPDLPGFGESENPGSSFSPLDYALFLDNFMGQLGIDRADLVGQSLGGGVALSFVLKFPDRVKKLVLVDSAGLGREVVWTLRLMSLPLLGKLFCRPGRRSTELFFRFAVNDRRLITSDFVDIYSRFFARPEFRAFLVGIVRTMITLHGVDQRLLGPVLDNLGDIKQPTLIVWGRDDRVLPLEHGRRGARRLPNATLEIVEGCGHIPFFERPELFNRMVLDFLSQGDT